MHDALSRSCRKGSANQCKRGVEQVRVGRTYVAKVSCSLPDRENRQKSHGVIMAWFLSLRFVHGPRGAPLRRTVAPQSVRVENCRVQKRGTHRGTSEKVSKWAHNFPSQLEEILTR